MSDYGDDSDYELDWMWIEEEYSAADDLAEHVVHSPPPTLNIDEDDLVEWDRFEYFNDLEYDSDGYDEATFAPHNSKGAKATQRTGQKRKRNGAIQRQRKRSKVEGDRIETPPKPVLPPVAWRSRGNSVVPIVKDESLKPVAFLKDWRRTMPKTPSWATGSLTTKLEDSSSTLEGKTALMASIDDEIQVADNEEGQEEGSEEMETVDPAALMAALQKNLAAAGGPLSGMDPQQLLQFAMRMLNNQEAGDDIAGELADSMLQQGDEEVGEDEEDDPELVSWLARQRNSTQGDPVMEDATNIPKQKQSDHRPPTPSSLKNVQDLVATKDVEISQQINPDIPDYPTIPTTSSQVESSRKRKADEEVEDDHLSTTSPKKRATRSNNVSARGSHAKAGVSSTRTMRSGRTNR